MENILKHNETCGNKLLQILRFPIPAVRLLTLSTSIIGNNQNMESNRHCKWNGNEKKESV